MSMFYTTEQILDRKDSLILKSDDQQYRQYVISTVLAYRTKLNEGAMFDCEKLAKELTEILLHKARIHPSPLFVCQINYGLLELYVKKKNKEKQQAIYTEIRTSMRYLHDQDRQAQLMKINSLILYDHNFEVIPQSVSNPSVKAIRAYRQGNILQAIDILKQTLDDFSQLTIMKKVLIGKMYLELTKLQAFEWLFEVTIMEKHEYEKFQAKVLFSSGYRTLSSKMHMNFTNCRIKNVQALATDYTNDLKTLNQSCSKAKLQQFRHEYAKGMDHKLSITERIQHLNKALQKLKKLPCYPQPSLHQCDIRIGLAEGYVESGFYEEGRENIEVVIQLSNQMDLFKWTRELKTTKALAQVYEHQNNINDAVNLIQRCIELEPENTKKVDLSKWSVKLSKKSKGNDEINPAKSKAIEVRANIQRKQPAKGSQQTSKPSKSSKKAKVNPHLPEDSDVQLAADPTKPEQTPKSPQQKSCCSLI